MKTEILLLIIYLAGVFCFWAWTAFEYGKAAKKERDSNAFAIIPIIAILWPLGIPLFPIVLILVMLINLGEKSNKLKYGRKL